MCVCVCVRGKNNIKEGKGRLKSWTLCNGLSEGVIGQGLAAPPHPPRPRPPVVSRRDGRTNITEGDPHGSRAPVVAWGAIKNQASAQCKLPADLSDAHWGHS